MADRRRHRGRTSGARGQGSRGHAARVAGCQSDRRGRGHLAHHARHAARIGVSETDFIRECDASFKQGSKFERWVNGREHDYYFHPFVLPQGYTETNLVAGWLKRHATTPFADLVSFQPHLCAQGKAPKQITTPEYAAVANYAYHLDAGKFGVFLRDYCVGKLGVQHVLDHMTGIEAARERRHRRGGDARSRLARGRSVRRLHRAQFLVVRRALRRAVPVAAARAVQRHGAGAAGALCRRARAHRLAHHLHRAERRLDLGYRPADAPRHRARVLEQPHQRRGGRARARGRTSNAPAARHRRRRRASSRFKPGYRRAVLAPQLRRHRTVGRVHRAAGSVGAGAGRAVGRHAERRDAGHARAPWTSSRGVSTTSSPTAGNESSISSSCTTC